MKKTRSEKSRDTVPLSRLYVFDPPVLKYSPPALTQATAYLLGEVQYRREHSLLWSTQRTVVLRRGIMLESLYIVFVFVKNSWRFDRGLLPLAPPSASGGAGIWWTRPPPHNCTLPPTIDHNHPFIFLGLQAGESSIVGWWATLAPQATTFRTFRQLLACTS